MNIVVLDGYTLNPGDNPWDDVARLGTFTCHDRTAPELIIERARDADIILTNKTPLAADTMARLPQLKFIGVLATGYNVVDVKAARERGIVVANVPEYSTDSVAELVFAFLLNFHRQPQLHSDLVRHGEWSKSEWAFWRTPLTELAGLTMGIVGFGRIGRRVGELAVAFKMKVLAASRSRSQPPYPVAWRDVPTLFAEADVVTLHCPLTAETAGMVNQALLERMKPTAYFINTGRGPLVNETDLAEILRRGRIAGAALDVASREPLPADSPLLTAPNLTITPHIAWATLAARRRLMKITADNIATFLAGRPINVVH